MDHIPGNQIPIPVVYNFPILLYTIAIYYTSTFLVMLADFF